MLNWNKSKSLSERFIFESRWLLLPFMVGLICALVVYEVRFALALYHFLTESFHADLEDVLVLLLGLVDCSMVANLIVIIVVGSYQIFIHKFPSHEGSNPGWLEHIDTGLLKVKTAQSIASITGVALLKDFVNVSHLDWTMVEHRLIIHGVCLVSAVVMAIIWRMTHVDEPHAKQEEHKAEHIPVPEAIGKTIDAEQSKTEAIEKRAESIHEHEHEHEQGVPSEDLSPRPFMKPTLGPLAGRGKFKPIRTLPERISPRPTPKSFYSPRPIPKPFPSTRDI